MLDVVCVYSMQNVKKKYPKKKILDYFRDEILEM